MQDTKDLSELMQERSRPLGGMRLPIVRPGKLGGTPLKVAGTRTILTKTILIR